MEELHYTEKLTRDIHTEKEKLSFLCPQICYYELQCAMVQKENHEMKLIVEALQNERAQKEAEFQALKEELEKLKLLQQENKRKSLSSGLSTKKKFKSLQI
ncbi:hypothetical protein JCGZ_00439 [Jatropha curcas]|uniref:Uncharacterized protein n=1 Tax=Jatropha curcas TaxID=180498 RepID=A0A067JG85_JATCU|nr:hypothetical protein JCGZ_00439 [Jatropha curcas]